LHSARSPRVNLPRYNTQSRADYNWDLGRCGWMLAWPTWAGVAACLAGRRRLDVVKAKLSKSTQCASRRACLILPGPWRCACASGADRQPTSHAYRNSSPNACHGLCSPRPFSHRPIHQSPFYYPTPSSLIPAGSGVVSYPWHWPHQPHSTPPDVLALVQRRHGQALTCSLVPKAARSVPKSARSVPQSTSQQCA